MCASEVLRARKTLGVGLYEETSEVRNQGVDFSHFICPPLSDFRYKRVRSLQAAKGCR